MLSTMARTASRAISRFERPSIWPHIEPDESMTTITFIGPLGVSITASAGLAGASRLASTILAASPASSAVVSASTGPLGISAPSVVGAIFSGTSGVGTFGLPQAATSNPSAAQLTSSLYRLVMINVPFIMVLRPGAIIAKCSANAKPPTSPSILSPNRLGAGG